LKQQGPPAKARDNLATGKGPKIAFNKDLPAGANVPVRDGDQGKGAKFKQVSKTASVSGGTDSRKSKPNILGRSTVHGSEAIASPAQDEEAKKDGGQVEMAEGAQMPAPTKEIRRRGTIAPHLAEAALAGSELNYRRDLNVPNV
jgi:hypothetical protein